MSDLHAQIMNLQCTPDESAGINHVLAFKMGHKQARHDAAELAMQHDKQVEELQAKLAMQDEALKTCIVLHGYRGSDMTLFNLPMVSKAISATSEDVAAWKEKQLAPLQREVAMLRMYAKHNKHCHEVDRDAFDERFCTCGLERTINDTQATAEAYEEKIRTEVLEEAKQVCRDEENKAWAFKGTAAWSSYMEGISDGSGECADRIEALRNKTGE